MDGKQHTRVPNSVQSDIESLPHVAPERQAMYDLTWVTNHCHGFDEL